MDNKKIDRIIKNLKQLKKDYPYKFKEKEEESSDDDCGGDN